MRTETITKTILTFDELSEDQQNKVMEKLYYINVDHDWYDFIYEDANNIGLKITGFDIGRSNYCEIDFIEDHVEIAKKIILEHGASCESYKTAQNFLRTKMSEEDFEKEIAEDYLRMLRNEYEYLTSEEAIKETIKANEYEFDADTLEIY